VNLKFIRKTTLLASILTLFILMLGAYTRLSDAGLGCPDWPGCYGKLVVPSGAEGLARANELYPDKPLEPSKAWIEMLHRYAAGILGLVILFITSFIVKNRKLSGIGHNMYLALLILVVVIFQALLGMWTVTQLVKPTIVTLHLLGGVTTVSLLWFLYLRLRNTQLTTKQKNHGTLPTLAVIGIFLLLGQIALGGWVSTNYAALACVDFPGCYQGKFFPDWNLTEAFSFNLADGVNYEGGIFANDTRATIHMLHRIGAVIIFLYFSIFSLIAIKLKRSEITMQVIVLISVLLIQLLLGISNVIFSLPLPVAVLHNGAAAVLLLVIITIAYSVKAS